MITPATRHFLWLRIQADLNERSVLAFAYVLVDTRTSASPHFCVEFAKAEHPFLSFPFPPGSGPLTTGTSKAKEQNYLILSPRSELQVYLVPISSAPLVPEETIHLFITVRDENVQIQFRESAEHLLGIHAAVVQQEKRSKMPVERITLWRGRESDTACEFTSTEGKSPWREANSQLAAWADEISSRAEQEPPMVAFALDYATAQERYEGMYPLLPRDTTHANLGCYLRTLCVERAGRVYVDMDPFAPAYTPAQARQLASDLQACKEPWSMCEVLLDFYEIQEDARLSPGHPASSARDSCEMLFPSFGVLLDGEDAEQTAIHVLQYGLVRCVEKVLPALNAAGGLQVEQMAETLRLVKRSPRKRLEKIVGSSSAMSVVREVWFILNALAAYHLNWQTKGEEYVRKHRQFIVNYEIRLLDSLRKLRLIEDGNR